jgi:hypothetical protein
MRRPALIDAAVTAFARYRANRDSGTDIKHIRTRIAVIDKSKKRFGF